MDTGHIPKYYKCLIESNILVLPVDLFRGFKTLELIT